MDQNNNQDKHLFSFYAPNIINDHWKLQTLITIDDADLLHRLTKVIKVQIGENIIIFNQKQHVLVTIETISKKSIQIKIQSIEKNKINIPNITFLLPLLKKEALEQAVYSLCEMGVSSIQLVITQKSRSSLTSEKEFNRLQSITVAAAEQSKNYTVSNLIAPQKLEKMMQSLTTDTDKIVFDISGKSFFELRESISKQNIYLLVGPEAGLATEELNFAQSYNFKMCALTSTTLRAMQAVTVASALFRLK